MKVTENGVTVKDFKELVVKNKLNTDYKLTMLANSDTPIGEIYSIDYPAVTANINKLIYIRIRGKITISEEEGFKMNRDYNLVPIDNTLKEFLKALEYFNEDDIITINDEGSVFLLENKFKDIKNWNVALDKFGIEAAMAQVPILFDFNFISQVTTDVSEIP